MWYKTLHSGLIPPLVWQFNLQPVVREFHQPKYARNFLDWFETDH